MARKETADARSGSKVLANREERLFTGRIGPYFAIELDGVPGYKFTGQTAAEAVISAKRFLAHRYPTNELVFEFEDPELLTATTWRNPA